MKNGVKEIINLTLLRAAQIGQMLKLLEPTRYPAKHRIEFTDKSFKFSAEEEKPTLNHQN